jgi:hypothetical protein
VGSGAPTEKCIACHTLSDIGLKTVKGIAIEKSNSKTNILHKSIKDIRCYYCHTEHNGLSIENATLIFTHTVLSQQMQNECAGCHSEKKPDNIVHNSILANCSNCHNTENWKRAEFKHELVGEKNNDCRSCHIENIPDDGLHKGIANIVRCVQCHNTNAWKPAAFEHTKYFRFDNNHPSDCTKCHSIKADYKSYTCYNCHEHQQSRIAEKHLEEGIRDFNNCVKCHRSGDEDEAKGKGNANFKRRENDDD